MLLGLAGGATAGLSGCTGLGDLDAGPGDGVAAAATAGRWYEGLFHAPLGEATLEETDGTLVVSTSDSDGDDGVRIDVGETTGHMLTGPVDPTAIPTGASLDNRYRGVVGGEPDQPLFSVRRTRTDSGFELQPDFSPVGSDTYTLRLLDGGDVVFEGSGFAEPTAVAAEGGFEGEWCKKLFKRYCEVEVNTQVTLPTGEDVAADRWEFEPDDPNQDSAVITSYDLVADGLSEFRIDGESVEAFGRSHSQRGAARLEPLDGGSRLRVSNVGSTGTDGVTAALDTTERFEADLEPVDLGTEGASVRLFARGIFDGTPDSPLGTAALTNDGDRLRIDVDYDAVGSSTVRAVVLEGGDRVGEVEVPTGTVGSVRGNFSLTGCGKRPPRPPRPPCMLERFDPAAGAARFSFSDGSEFEGEEVRLLAGDPDGEFSGLSAFGVEAGNVDGFVVTGERV